MSEITKAVGQWIVGNVGWTIIIALFIVSGLFKITKIEVNPLGWVLGVIGKSLNKDTNAKIDKLKADSNQQVQDLRDDLDEFEKKTNKTMADIQKGSMENCRAVKRELDAMKKSNDLQTVRQIRAHVLDFANSCMNGRRHTKQDFENIIDENTTYNDLVKKHKIKNKVYEEDYNYIMKIYHKCQDNNSFLKAPEETTN